MSQFNPSMYQPKPKPPADPLDLAGHRAMSMGLPGFGVWLFVTLMQFLFPGVEASPEASTPKGFGLMALSFMVLLVAFGVYCVAFGIIGRIINLRDQGHVIAFGWVGSLLGIFSGLNGITEAISRAAGSQVSAEQLGHLIGASLSGPNALIFGCMCALGMLVGPVLASIGVTWAIVRTSILHAFLVTIILWLTLIVAMVGFAITMVIIVVAFPSLGPPKKAPQSIPEAEHVIQNREQAKRAQADYEAQSRQSKADSDAAEAKRISDHMATLSPAGRIFYQLGSEKPTPAFATSLRDVIRNRAQVSDADFLGEFTVLMEASPDKRRILDICISEQAGELAAPTFRSMLNALKPGDEADALINRYLFTPSLSTPQVFRAAYKLNPTLSLEKFKNATDKEPIVRDLIAAIAANDPNAPAMVKIALETADSRQREEIYAVAFKAGTKPQTIQAIHEHWSATSPDTLSDVLKLYFQIASSTDFDPFDKDTVQALNNIEKPDRRVQKRIATLLLTSYRDAPTPDKLKALVKWHTDDTRRAVSDALNAVNTPAEASAKATDLRLAEEIELTDAIDHLIGVARSTPTPPEALLDYLRTDTLRVESTLLAAIEKAEYNLPQIENDLRILEEIGWKVSRQKLADAYKAAKTPADKKRFQDAEGKVQRYIATTLRTSPANNPDKPPFKPHGKRIESSASGGDSALFSSDGKTGPKSLNPEAEAPKSNINIATGDVVQITSVGATEFAVVAKIEPELVTVTLIKNDKMDFISRERIVKVVGTVDTPGIIEKLKAQMKGGAPATSATANPEPAKTDGKSGTNTPATPAKEPAAAAPAPASGIASKPAVGMKVEAKKFDEWHDATIEKIGNNQIYVTFDGKGGGWDAWLGLADVRPKGSKKTFMMLSMD
jgi:hypothetical protein